MIVLSVLAGEQIAGIPGVFISIPVVAVGIVIYRHVVDHRGERHLITSLLHDTEENLRRPPEMYYILWLAGFFLIILLISVGVYVAVVKAFYWGDKDGPPTKKR